MSQQLKTQTSTTETFTVQPPIGGGKTLSVEDFKKQQATYAARQKIFLQYLPVVKKQLDSDASSNDKFKKLVDKPNELKKSIIAILSDGKTSDDNKIANINKYLLEKVFLSSSTEQSLSIDEIQKIGEEIFKKVYKTPEYKKVCDDVSKIDPTPGYNIDADLKDAFSALYVNFIQAQCEKFENADNNYNELLERIKKVHSRTDLGSNLLKVKLMMCAINAPYEKVNA
jgi:uncharacterized protein YdcH (DUF465 family)